MTPSSVPEEDALLPNQSNKYIASPWDKVWGRCAGSPQTPGFVSCDRDPLSVQHLFKPPCITPVELGISCLLCYEHPLTSSLFDPEVLCLVPRSIKQ